MLKHPIKKKDILVLASVASVAIMILASTVCPMINCNDDSTDEYVVNTITTNNPIEQTIYRINDCISDSLESIDDSTCHSKIDVSDVFTGDDSDYWVDLTFTDCDGQIGMTYTTNAENADSINKYETRYQMNSEGAVCDLIISSDNKMISFNESYDQEDDCICVVDDIAVGVVVIGVVAIMAIKEICDENDKDDDSTPEDTGPNAITPIVGPDPVVEPEPVVVEPEPVVVEPEPEIVYEEFAKYGTMTGTFGWNNAKIVAKYYYPGPVFSGLLGKVAYALRLSTTTLSFMGAQWDKITPGISICECGDKLLGFSAMGSIMTIVDLITYDNANKLDSLKVDTYYFALLYYDKVIVVPIEINKSCAVCIMRMDQSTWKNPKDWVGLLNIWSREGYLAYDAAKEASNGLEPMFHSAHIKDCSSGYYDHYHTYNHMTDAHAFYGKPYIVR